MKLHIVLILYGCIGGKLAAIESVELILTLYHSLHCIASSCIFKFQDSLAGHLNLMNVIIIPSRLAELRKYACCRYMYVCCLFWHCIPQWFGCQKYSRKHI